MKNIRQMDEKNRKINEKSRKINNKKIEEKRMQKSNKE